MIWMNYNNDVWRGRCSGHVKYAVKSRSCFVFVFCVFVLCFVFVWCMFIYVLFPSQLNLCGVFVWSFRFTIKFKWICNDSNIKQIKSGVTLQTVFLTTCFMLLYDYLIINIHHPMINILLCTATHFAIRFENICHWLMSDWYVPVANTS